MKTIYNLGITLDTYWNQFYPKYHTHKIILSQLQIKYLKNLLHKNLENFTKNKI